MGWDAEGSPAASAKMEAKRIVAFMARYNLFWLLYFLLCRIVFVCYHAANIRDLSSLPGIFGYGAYMDLSASCALTVIPYLAWCTKRFLPIPGLRRGVNLYSALLIVLVALITVADLQVCEEWGTKLNAQALAYFRHPKVVFTSIASAPLLRLSMLLLLLSCSGLLLYVRVCRDVRFPGPGGGENWGGAFSRVILLPASAGLIFWGICGGAGVAVMNPSFVYFSPLPFANHAALNASWNLVYDIRQYLGVNRHGFVYMPKHAMRQRVDRLIGNRNDEQTVALLSTPRPNIVLFILESWTADVVAPLGGEQGITPFFGDLVREGVLCTDFYANGTRSAYGLAAVLAGYPSPPDRSILRQPLKMERLPTLAGTLKASGYATQYHYGGDARFDDVIALVRHSNFEVIVDRESFDKKDLGSRWGAQDEALFDRVINDLKGERTPFFSAMFTISTHEPFEVPMAPVYRGGEAALFKNAVRYSDRCLRHFFERARKEPWYNNTLFVFVADHGHYLPLHRNVDFVPERYHVPLLLYGDVLKREYRGTMMTRTASQVDIAATILAQLGLPHDQFQWSNNIFKRNRSDFAYYCFHNGFALRTPEQTTVYDNLAKKVVLRGSSKRTSAQNAESLKDAQAYMQCLYQQYHELGTAD
jgi:hypothetical protein